MTYPNLYFPTQSIWLSTKKKKYEEYEKATHTLQEKTQLVKPSDSAQMLKLSRQGIWNYYD